MPSSVLLLLVSWALYSHRPVHIFTAFGKLAIFYMENFSETVSQPKHNEADNEPQTNKQGRDGGFKLINS